MYHCIKLKHSVLIGMPIINSYARHLHVASKMLLRRKLSDTSSAYQEFEHFDDNSNPPAELEESSPDFFGIESDHGVITLNPCNSATPESIQKPRIREKFYSTSFGIVRYDSENKLRRHGQYGKTIELEFPHRSHDYAVVLKNLPDLAAKSDSALKVKNELENVNENIELHLNKQTPKSHNSYVDQIYFGNITDKENTNLNNNVNQKSAEELNFVDESYFSALTDSEVSNSSRNPICEEKDDLFIQRERSVDQPENVNQHDMQGLNFFDEMLFENAVNSNLQNFAEERFTNEGLTSDYPTAEILTVKTDENFSYSENNTVIKPRIDLECDNFLHTKKKNDFSKEYTQVSHLNSSSDMNYQNEKLKSSNENLNESIIHDAMEIPDPSAKRLRGKLSSERTEQKHRNSDFSAKAVESAAKENKFKYAITNSKEDPVTEPAAEEDISTAHDFVTKLRKEQEIPEPIIRKEKDFTKIKFDSKGFRILKNQVADLSYFTRDEILNLLVKNVAYSDDDLIVLNKPYGLVIHDSQTTKEPCLSTFLDDLAKEMDRGSNNPQLFTVHRIDKETTGCLLLARTEAMAQVLKSLFAQRKIIKKYWIITTRVPDHPEGIIDIPISEGSINNKKRMVLHPKLPKSLEYKNHSKSGKEAITSYKVLSESGNAALVEVMPKTGIKHQIRVHFGFGLSCPILGDHKYSHLDKLAPQVLQNDMLEKLHVRQSKVRYIPMHIHARTVIVPKYFEDRDLLVNIPLPEHMKQNLKMLKFRKKDMS